MKLTLSTPNLSAIVANFYAYDDDVQRGARQIVEDTGSAIVAIVQSIVPVDTGFMRDHVKAVLSPSHLVVTAGWDAGDFDAAGLPFYPPYVEFGTVKMSAQPSLFPAYAVVAPDFEADLSSLISGAQTRRAGRGR